VVFDLVKSFGFSEASLTSKNALIPIIYYLYHKDVYSCFNTQTQFLDDRKIIKKWLHTVLIKRVFGAASDSVLSQIRKAFIINAPTCFISDTQMQTFPIDKINSELKRDLGFTNEFIDDILLTQKDDAYAFSILALLYPNLDYKNNNFHKDHLHPKNNFDYLLNADKQNYKWESYNSILNLQLLDANENQSKKDKNLSTWVDSASTNIGRSTLLARQLIPNVSLELMDFGNFIEARKNILRSRLNEILA